MEIKILAAVISAREHWESVHPHITDSDLTPEGMVVWAEIKKYYTRDKSACKVDIDVLTKRVLRGVRHNSKHKELFKLFLERVNISDVSGINIISEVLEYKKDVVSLQLADALVSKNKKRSRDLIDKLQALDLSVDLDLGVDEEFQGQDVADLLQTVSPENLIKIAPRSLNTRLGGGALRGHHILVAASPETGKSLLALHMTNGFVQQGLKVLYIGNEDPISSLVLRFLGNLTSMTREQMLKDTKTAMHIANSTGYKRVVFIGLSPGTLPEIRSLINKHKPDVLIVDQVRNIQVKSENRTNQLEEVARGMRDFARHYNLLSISVTQAADTARNKLVLDMGDIDGSNVGMPGACDVMIMLGMNLDYYNTDQRMVTLAKNKLTGSHDSWPVRIDKYTSRVVEVIK